MATINLATKFEKRLDERFRLQSLTDVACGNQYDWDGVNAIKVWTLDAPVLTDYNPNGGMNRFGTVSEVTDELNTYQLMKKRSFSTSYKFSLHGFSTLKSAIVDLGSQKTVTNSAGHELVDYFSKLFAAEEKSKL